MSIGVPEGSELDSALGMLATALRAQNDAEDEREALSQRLQAATTRAVEARHAVDKADSRVRELLGGQYGC